MVIDMGTAKEIITEVLVRYATGIDRRDWDSFRTCFVTDCRCEYGDFGTFDGVEAITKFMTDSHADMGHTLHRLTNVAITVRGDKAEARTYVDAVLMSSDGATGVNPIGYYDDDLVHDGEVWRIAKRRLTMVALRTIG